jgi:hypothetical protein
MKHGHILRPGASGKSTLAAYFGQITGLPVIELDHVFWQPGLIATPRDQWMEVQQRLVEEDRWNMDGDLGPYLGSPRSCPRQVIITVRLSLLQHTLRPRNAQGFASMLSKPYAYHLGKILYYSSRPPRYCFL